MKLNPNQTRCTGLTPGCRPGFTLMELMVVVSLIVLLLGFSVPLVFKIDELSRDRSGVNTFGVAVTAARAFATRRIADDPPGDYSGAAVMVTPMNQLRIIGDRQVTDWESKGVSLYGYDNQTSRMEAISMPRGIGVVGITRTGGTATQLKMIPPPFVIRFNRHGQLITETRPTVLERAASAVGDENRNVVYIAPDPAQVGTMIFGDAAGGSRGKSTYDYTTWDPDINIAASGKWNATAKDWNMPFSALESVIGVIVYSKADFEDAGGKLAAAPTSPAQGYPDNVKPGVADEAISKWMFANGSVLFFSRNTGNILRTKMP